MLVLNKSSKIYELWDTKLQKNTQRISAQQMCAQNRSYVIQTAIQNH